MRSPLARSCPALPALVLLALLLPAARLAAQPAGAPEVASGKVPLAATPPALSVADTEWATLKNLDRPKTLPAPAANAAAAVWQATDLIPGGRSLQFPNLAPSFT